ncbi:MAG: hypothetical protein QME47_07955 [Candidatus Thermoplasmatota archaeon]|nr:hypothetical protein [Candidatus Thermoplasmatota archaeon]
MSPEKLKEVKRQKAEQIPPNLKNYFEKRYGIEEGRKKALAYYTRVPQTIDLVATDGKEYTGYEVKLDLPLSTGQLKSYLDGQMLDSIYLVIPCEAYDKVTKKHGNQLKNNGIGVITLRNSNFEIVEEAKKHKRLNAPKIKMNEAWLKQKFWNYFETKEFDVYGDTVLPNPRKTHRDKISTPASVIQKIDLSLFPKGKNSTAVLDDQEHFDHIGIEVKYGIKSWKKIVKQLDSYAESGGLTKLYLGICSKDKKIAGALKNLEKRTFGILLYDNETPPEKVEVLAEPQKLQMRVALVGYQRPSWKKAIYVFVVGKPQHFQAYNYQR